MSNEAGTDPEPRGPSGATAAWGAAALVLATVLAGALLPARNGTPPARNEAPPAQPVAASPERDPNCAQWTDGCRLCSRFAEGPVCSTPGIACLPGETRCTARAGR